MKLLYKNNKLYCDDVLLESVVKQYGTPLYVYSHSGIKNNFNAYKKAFGKISNIICFALKNNSNISIVKCLAELGAGADIVSGGELFRAIKAKVPTSKIVYSGVGKTYEEIDFAIKSSILMFNIESISELNLINIRAAKLNKKAGISVRVNPNINPRTHPHISTGLLENKFGIDIKHSREVYAYAKELKNIEIKGIHMHIGSQITTVSPYIEAIGKIMDTIKVLASDGIRLSYINIGGGLGIEYNTEKPPTPKKFLQRVLPLIKDKNLNIIIEPGRSITGNAGLLITKVLYNKKTGKKNFVIVDAGMNDIPRPSLYGAYHEIIPLEKPGLKQNKILADVVGPICESTDFIAKNRELYETTEGEYLAVKNAGAYCFSMASNYNSRRRAAEVLIKEKEVCLIRQRETFNDLIHREKIYN